MTNDVLPNVRIDPITMRGTAGFYRVGQSTRGRWWLIAPDGRPLIYKGCNAALRQALGQAGKNLYFQWVEFRYGADTQGFIRDTAATLRAAGFNGWGGWSMLFTPNEGHRDNGMPFVEIINSRAIAGSDHLVAGNLDVFDPLVWERIDKTFKTQWAPLCDNPNLLGYFCDNECMYGQPNTAAAWTGKFSDLQKPPSHPTLLQLHLALPGDRPGHRWAWDWVLSRHGGSVARLSRDWRVAFSSPGDLRRQTESDGLVLASDAYAEDHAALTRIYVREYYRHQHELIRRHDPNHLIMTTRHPAPPGPLVIAAVRACFADGLIDVAAMNNYRDRFKQRLDEYCPDGFLPIINGEFSWCSGHFLDWGRFLREERFTGEEMAEIAVRGQVALEQAFTHPSLIGYTWFKWYSGIEFTSNEYGLATDLPFGAVVNNRGELNTFNQPLFRRIHARLEGIAAGSLAPVPDPGLDAVPQTDREGLPLPVHGVP